MLLIPGFLYLIITREFLVSKQSVYKFGRTDHMDRRFTNYPPGSRLVISRPVVDMINAEVVLKHLCRSRFTPRREFGTEYIEAADEAALMATFHTVCDLFPITDEQAANLAEVAAAKAAVRLAAAEKAAAKAAAAAAAEEKKAAAKRTIAAEKADKAAAEKAAAEKAAAEKAATISGTPEAAKEAAKVDTKVDTKVDKAAIKAAAQLQLAQETTAKDNAARHMLAEWLAQHVEVTGKSKDKIVLGELKKCGDAKLAQMGVKAKDFMWIAKEFFASVQGATWKENDRLKIDGSWVTTRNVVRGVRTTLPE